MKVATGLSSVLALLLLPGVVCGMEETGKCVGVISGDTIIVTRVQSTKGEWPPFYGRVVVKLWSIEAPEQGQPYARESRNHLRKLIYGKDVFLDCGARRSYWPHSCHVFLPDVCGVGVFPHGDPALEQVKAGLAWHDKQHQDEQTPHGFAELAAAEDTARKARRGLWADAHPVEPQDFRHGVHSGLCFALGDKRIACRKRFEGPQGPVKGCNNIYHWRSCPDYDEIDEISCHNKPVEFPNCEAAEAAGYEAAGNCE